MFNSVALDVVIGLVFIYLLYSLLATIVQELFASAVNLRAKMLKLAITRMLNDDFTSENKEDVFNERLRRSLFFRTNNYKGTLAEKFYLHPSIKYLGDQSWHSKPAYLSAQNFSNTLIDMLRGDDFRPGDNTALRINEKLFSEGKDGLFANAPQTRYHIRTLMSDAHGDIFKFRQLLEQWFNDMMDRTTGWYKRASQYMLFIIGFAISISFNVDTISIVKQLSKDKATRDQMAAFASNNYQNLNPDLIGNDSLTNEMLSNIKNNITGVNTILSSPDSSGGFALFGCLLTTLAISLGAPFWYDLLSKLVKVRGAGPVPDKTSSKQGATNSNSAEAAG